MTASLGAPPEILEATYRAMVAARPALTDDQVDADTLASEMWLNQCIKDDSFITYDGFFQENDMRRAFRAGLAHARSTAPNAADVAELVTARQTT